MKTIAVPLTRGMTTVIDAADEHLVRGYTWFAKPSGGKGRQTFYAANVRRVNGRNTTVYLHRLIVGAQRGQIVDHRDGDTLNNTRANLRIGTQAQNMANAGMRPQNTSGYIGVTWRRDTEKWQAQIQVKGKCINLGSYDDPKEAAEARAKYARSVHGEWASRMEVE